MGNALSRRAVMDSPFCLWIVRFAEDLHFWRNGLGNVALQLTTLETPTCVVAVQAEFLMFPSFALGVCVFTFDWRFLAVGCGQSPEENQAALLSGFTPEEGCQAACVCV